MKTVKVDRCTGSDLIGAAEPDSCSCVDGLDIYNADEGFCTILHKIQFHGLKRKGVVNRKKDGEKTVLYLLHLQY